MNLANPVDSLGFVRSCLGRQAALWAMRELLSMRQIGSQSLGESESPYAIK
jgi:hypothetical protein